MRELLDNQELLDDEEVLDDEEERLREVCFEILTQPLIEIFAIIDKLMGAIVLTLFSTPLIALYILCFTLKFLDSIYEGQISQALGLIIFSPFLVLFSAITGVIFPLYQGHTIGLLQLIKTFPKRVSYFFENKLFYGSQENESIIELIPSDLRQMFNKSSGLLYSLTLKLFTLMMSMEYYMSFNARNESPHNDVNLYFTAKNLSLLKEKYKTIDTIRSVSISREISTYLALKLDDAKRNVSEEKKSSSNDGKLQSYQDELDAILAAQRCVSYFKSNKNTAPDLSKELQFPSIIVLNYIWLAIENECPDEDNKNILKEKLIWALFQIQRGFNIAQGFTGADMPECPTGAIGLLIRVICNEQDKMPESTYESSDPTPANLALALQVALNRPFLSKNVGMNSEARANYQRDPENYKKNMKDQILDKWKFDFGPLLNNDILKEDKLEEIINGGIDGWEPPAEPVETRSYSI